MLAEICSWLLRAALGLGLELLLLQGFVATSPDSGKFRSKSSSTKRIPGLRHHLHASDSHQIASMDVQMVDQPADRTDPLTLLEEDELRQIARHVKSYIPGNSNGNINEEST